MSIPDKSGHNKRVSEYKVLATHHMELIHLKKASAQKEKAGNQLRKATV